MWVPLFEWPVACGLDFTLVACLSVDYYDTVHEFMKAVRPELDEDLASFLDSDHDDDDVTVEDDHRSRASPPRDMNASLTMHSTVSSLPSAGVLGPDATVSTVIGSPQRRQQTSDSDKSGSEYTTETSESDDSGTDTEEDDALIGKVCLSANRPAEACPVTVRVCHCIGPCCR